MDQKQSTETTQIKFNCSQLNESDVLQLARAYRNEEAARLIAKMVAKARLTGSTKFKSLLTRLPFNTRTV